MMKPSVIFLALVCLGPPNASCVPRVEYIPGPAFKHEIANPPEINQICKEVQAMLQLTNGYRTNETIIAWSLKKIEGDRPPILVEEVVLYFEIVGKRTNSWITSCPTRNAGRGGLGLDSWQPSLGAVDMKWVAYGTKRPDVNELVDFIRHSNFAYNECDPDIEPIHAEVYAPYKRLVTIVSEGINSNEKRRRFNTRDDLLIEGH